MKIIKPAVEFINKPDWEKAMKTIELCGRTCYKSEHRITDNSAKVFIKNLIKRGHEAVLEHFSFTVKFICDRGITHQIVRHRLSSFCQESTRYCRYDDDKFDNQISVIKPCFFEPGDNFYELWKQSCEQSEKAYFDLLEKGAKPEEARSVLPNSLKTELVMTTNIREWRHFLKLRSSAAAHPQIRELAYMLLVLCDYENNVLFQDIQPSVDTKK